MCLFSYAHWQPSYQELQEKWGDKIIFTESIPTEEDIRDVMHDKKHGIFVVDDKASDITDNAFFMDLLVRMGHHYKMTNCLVVQDASMPGKTKSVLAKNIHVNIMMRSARDRGYLRTLGIMMNDYKCIISAYDDACRFPFSYFVVDTHPSSNPDLKYRTSIFPTDECCIIYKSNKK